MAASSADNPAPAPSTPGHPDIETARLVLRPLVASDAAALHPAFSDPLTTRYLDFPTCRTLEETVFRVGLATVAMPEWHATWAVTAKPGSAIAGASAAASRLLGIVNYHHRESWHRRLEIGYVLARPFWHQGIASEAMRALLAYCFDILRMHRIEATIDPENEAGVRLAERLGFRREGDRLRDRMFVAGRHRDVVMYGLLEADWRAAAPAASGTARAPYLGSYLL